MPAIVTSAMFSFFCRSKEMKEDDCKDRADKNLLPLTPNNVQGLYSLYRKQPVSWGEREFLLFNLLFKFCIFLLLLLFEGIFIFFYI
jgi:hypothetical protein